MISYQLKIPTEWVTKYTLMIAAGCLVLTLLQIINMVNYVGSTYAIGAITTNRPSHIQNAIIITGFGCFVDTFRLVFYSPESNWVFVNIVLFFIRLLGVAYELVLILSLQCYWKYTESTIQPEKTWFQHKLGKLFSYGSG